MASDPNTVEHAVSRTLRENLEKIQHSAEELHQAVSDLVAACASTRPSNALPPMLRAQTSAAALSATLEVLSRFVTGALQPSYRMPFEPEILRVPSMTEAMMGSMTGVAPVPPSEQPPPMPPHPTQVSLRTAPAPVEPAPTLPGIPPPAGIPRIPEPSPVAEMPVAAEPAPALKDPALAPVSLPEQAPVVEPVLIVESRLESEPAEAAPIFSLDSLPPEEQELHRRAYRVAKVSMQDIKLLRPEEVRLGRQSKDLCFRLRDDIEKAHKEYDRRFQAIQSHPVDYFYDWMVEILAGGDPKALGEYPYPSPVLRR
jgi:hypothetical protein